MPEYHTPEFRSTGGQVSEIKIRLLCNNRLLTTTPIPLNYGVLSRFRGRGRCREPDSCGHTIGSGERVADQNDLDEKAGLQWCSLTGGCPRIKLIPSAPISAPLFAKNPPPLSPALVIGTAAHLQFVIELHRRRCHRLFGREFLDKARQSSELGYNFRRLLASPRPVPMSEMHACWSGWRCTTMHPTSAI